MLRLFTLYIFILLSLNSVAFGEDCAKIVVRFFTPAANNQEIKLTQGMQVELIIDNLSGVKAIYLGSLVSVSGKKDQIGFYVEEGNGAIHYIDRELLSFENPVKEKFIVRSTVQVGGTCAAYSTFNCFREMALRGLNGNGNIETKLVDEEARSSTLVSIINAFYIKPSGVGTENILRKISNDYGYLVYKIPRNDNFKTKIEEFINFFPVLLDFHVRKDMSTTLYTILGHETGVQEVVKYDRRLWQPTNDSNLKDTARHMVLAMGVFESNGKKKLLVLDPNWKQPRLWDFNTLDNPNVNAHVIHQP